MKGKVVLVTAASGGLGMIQPLRVVHRRAFFALAAILPLIIAAELSSRQNRVSYSPTLPSAPLGATRASAASVIWKRRSFTSDVLLESGNSLAPTLVLKSTHELSDPDLLLYWADHDVSADVRFIHDCAMSETVENQGCVLAMPGQQK